MAARTNEPMSYYVYALIDPRNEKTFYIGKGQGRRLEAHEKEAKRGIEHPKCEVIREIWAAGLEVKRKILKWFRGEDAAYNYEKRVIAKRGLNNLANLAAGGRSAWVKPNKGFTKDLAIAVVTGHLMKMKAQGLRIGLRIGGWHEISEERITQLLAIGREVINRRGEAWFNRNQGFVKFVSA